MSEQITLESDIYSLCLITAHSYYALLRRRDMLAEEIILASPPPPDGQPHGGNFSSNETADKAERLIMRRERLDVKIKAIEQAWNTMPDDTSREFIRLNMFERIGADYIALPLSRKTMYRRRHLFLAELAKDLYEI